MKIKSKSVFLAIIFLLAFMLAGFGSINQQAGKKDFMDYYLFIEYEVYTKAEREDGKPVLSNTLKEEGYSYNVKSSTIVANTKINNKAKDLSRFLFGSNMLLESNQDSEILVSFKYLIALINFNSMVDSTLSNALQSSFYSFSCIDCSPTGEAKILFNNEEITLKPGEVFNDSFVYRDITIKGIVPGSYNFIEDIITIANRGFIKKSDVSYY